MGRDFLPRQQLDLLGWSQNFLSRLQTPGSDYGISADQISAYQALHQDFAEWLSQSITPRTRNAVVNNAKEQSRKSLESNARLLARIIRANPSVTTEQRINLRLSERIGLGDGKGTPIGAPQIAPSVRILSVSQRIVQCKVVEIGSTRSGLPAGVAGVRIYYIQADAPPADLNAWHFYNQFTRTRCTLEFGPELRGGTPVWIAARFVNPRGQVGPASLAIYAYLGAPARDGLPGPVSIPHRLAA